jgi:hypothetical protein
MAELAALLALASGACGAVSAWLWWRSATVQTVLLWHRADLGGSGFEPVIAEQAQAGWLVGTLQAAAEVARWNRRAALATAVAVLLSTAAALVGLFA